MVEFDKNSKIGDIVAARPSLSRIMDRHGISYCCGGGKSLELACTEKGLSIDKVLAEIAQAMTAPAEKNLTTLSLGDLVEYVVTQHHCFLRETLPVVSRQLERVVTVHGARHPELAKAQTVFQRFANEMTQHMEKEEQVLFPVISSLEGSEEHPMAANLEHIIAAMEAEHDHSGRDLTEMRTLLHDYTPPDGACGTYKAVLRGLADIEEDTQRHIHAENSVMFPKAIGRVAAKA